MRVPKTFLVISLFFMLLRSVSCSSASLLTLGIISKPCSQLRPVVFQDYSANVQQLFAALPSIPYRSVQEHCGVSCELYKRLLRDDNTVLSGKRALSRNVQCLTFGFPCVMPLLRRTSNAVVAAVSAAATHATRNTASTSSQTWSQLSRKSGVRHNGYSSEETPSQRLQTKERACASYLTQVTKEKGKHQDSNKVSSSNKSLRVYDLRILEGVLYPDIQATTHPAGNSSRECSGASRGSSAGNVVSSELGRLILLVLNQPVPPYFDRLLQSASLVVASDGAANHLLDVFRPLEEELIQKRMQKTLDKHGKASSKPLLSGCWDHEGNARESSGSTDIDGNADTPLWSGIQKRQLPACICGDLDSAYPEALSFFKERGVPIIRMEDQDTTDLEKTFDFVAEKYNFSPADTLLVIGAIGGRFDHSMASISFLYKIHSEPMSQKYSLPNVVLLGGDNLCILLKEGANEILLSDVVFSRACGLLPLGGMPIRCVYSEGLEWNVKGDSLAMGKFISSSNRRTSDRIKVRTSDDLLFFCELNKVI